MLLSLLFALLLNVCIAQEEGIPGLPPGEPPPVEQVDALAQDIAEGLRCPVCQGMSVADSTTPTAVQMQRRIHELVAMGYTEGQIIDFFIDRYGEFVLLEPPREGINWLIWIGPGVAGGLGIVAAFMALSGFRREEDGAPRRSIPSVDEIDPFEARLLAELEAEE